MASSRVVLSPLGWSVIVGGLVALLFALVTLNLLMLLVPVAVLGIVATELLVFDRTTSDFGPEWFRWQRFENSSEVRIDGVGSMALDLSMTERRGVYAEVYDPQPDSFEVVEGSARLLTWWPDSESVRLAYVYRPRARGRFRVGPTIVVAHDPLGFGFRMAKLENRWEVLVTPALTVEETSSIATFGARGSSESHRRRVGPGSEFHALREYLPSDDARKIAWRRSGLDKVYVREHEEEVHPDWMVLLDAGWEMRLGMPGTESLELGVEGGIVIAGQAIGRSDRVSLLVYSDHVLEFVPPQRGPPGAEVLTQAFGRVGLAPGRFDLAGALYTAQKQLTAPTAIVVFSSLLSPAGMIAEAVAAVRASNHRLIAICPEVATLYPPEPDPVAARTMEFTLAPVEQQVDRGVQQLRDAGVTVVLYPAVDIRETAVEVQRWVRSGGGSP